MGNAQTKAKRKYNKANYFRVSLMIPLNRAAPLREYAKRHGTTVNKLLNDHITELLTGHGVSVQAETMGSMRNLHEWELEHTGAKDIAASENIDTCASIESDIATRAAAAKTPRRPPPMREMVELWDELHTDGLSFAKIAKGADGNGYGKSTVHKAVTEYRKALETD